jgi:hypothetical protein
MGWMLRPMNLLVLTTKGRKSGQPRHTVLEYRRHGSKLYLVSAWGNRPNWINNLQADSTVTVQLGQKEIAAKAMLRSRVVVFIATTLSHLETGLGTSLHTGSMFPDSDKSNALPTTGRTATITSTGVYPKLSTSQPVESVNSSAPTPAPSPPIPATEPTDSAGK